MLTGDGAKTATTILRLRQKDAMLRRLKAELIVQSGERSEHGQRNPDL